MITINDDDTPIVVAEKIIAGARPFDPSPIEKAFCSGPVWEIPMFDLNEIEEIADHLFAYCKAHAYCKADADKGEA